MLIINQYIHLVFLLRKMPSILVLNKSSHLLQSTQDLIYKFYLNLDISIQLITLLSVQLTNVSMLPLIHSQFAFNIPQQMFSLSKNAL